MIKVQEYFLISISMILLPLIMVIGGVYGVFYLYRKTQKDKLNKKCELAFEKAEADRKLAAEIEHIKNNRKNTRALLGRTENVRGGNNQIKIKGL